MWEDGARVLVQGHDETEDIHQQDSHLTPSLSDVAEIEEYLFNDEVVGASEVCEAHVGDDQGARGASCFAVTDSDDAKEGVGWMCG